MGRSQKNSGTKVMFLRKRHHLVEVAPRLHDQPRRLGRGQDGVLADLRAKVLSQDHLRQLQRLEANAE